MIFAPNESAVGTTAGAGAVLIAMAMTPRRQYRLTAKDAGLWFKVALPAADAATVGGALCHYIAAGAWIDVAAISARDHISIIRDTGTDATGILSEIANVVG